MNARRKLRNSRSICGRSKRATAAIASGWPTIGYDALVEMSDRAISLWLSIREAAYRRERATLEIHCPQIRALTLGAFETVKALPPRERGRRVNYLSPDDERLAESAPAFSDEALALQFAERHAGDLRYVAAWNKWLFWNGSSLAIRRPKLRACDLSRKVCREAAANATRPRSPRNLASAKTVCGRRAPRPSLIGASPRRSTNGTPIRGS